MRKRGGRHTAARRRSYRTGLAAELAGAALLTLKGYRIVARRYRCPAGEIDLIARRGRTVAFVEVKARTGLSLASEAITPHQRRRIVRAAAIWCAAHRPAPDTDFRFDAILIVPGRLPVHISNAFAAGDDAGWR